MTLYKKFEVECKSYECGIADSIAKPPDPPVFTEKTNEREKKIALEVQIIFKLKYTSVIINIMHWIQMD